MLWQNPKEATRRGEHQSSWNENLVKRAVVAREWVNTREARITPVVP
jgi:hypothetical protein